MDNKYVQSSKVLNARKRFRQGRSSFKKLKSVVREEIRKFMENEDRLKTLDSVELPVESVSPENHIHDESCHHLIKHEDTK